MTSNALLPGVTVYYNQQSGAQDPSAGGPPVAVNVYYDNDLSGLAGANVQAAIDALDAQDNMALRVATPDVALPPLPAWNLRKNKLLAFNAAGDPVALDGAVFVSTVAALEALTEPAANLNLGGYDTNYDGGGGLLVHDAASTATVDNATVFGPPAIIGRYIRPVDGILHSRWFGLMHSTAKDQSARLQDFLYELCVPAGTPQKSYRGMIDPGTIDCAGATLFMNRDGVGDGSGFFHNSAYLIGASRRYSLLANVVLSVGSPPWLTSTASGGVVLRDFRIDGRLHAWNIENNSMIENVGVYRAARDTQASPLVPNYPDFTGPPNVSDPGGGQTWRQWADNWMFLTRASNHPLFVNLQVSGKAGSGIPSGDYRPGAMLYQSVNVRFLQGQIFGCNPGVVIDAAGAGDNYLDGLKFEECEGNHVWVRAGEDHIVSTFNRQGAGHNTTEPLIRIGEQGISTPKNVDVDRCTFFSDQSGLGRAVYVEQVTGCTVKNNSFERFATAVDIRANAGTIGGARTVADVLVTDVNRYETNTTKIARGARSQPLVPAAGGAERFEITQGVTPTWSGYNGVNQSIHTNLSRTITLGEMDLAGMRYQLTITKGNTAHVITWAGDALKWAGAVPDFAAMTTTQHAIVTVEIRDTGSGIARLASSQIYG